jgi:hypothetical protein
MGDTEAIPSLDASCHVRSYGSTQTGTDLTPRAAAWGPRERSPRATESTSTPRAAWGWARVTSVACTTALLVALAGGARGGIWWWPATSAAAGWPSGANGVLYAMPNTEGLGRQMGSLSCYVAVAAARNLELVVVPFASGHDYGGTNNSWLTSNSDDVAQENVVYMVGRCKLKAWRPC